MGHVASSLPRFKTLRIRTVFSVLWVSGMAQVVKNVLTAVQRHRKRGFDPRVGKIPWRRK